MNIIDEITIKGFKSIQDQTVKLGQLNVLIGTNGAGKSNFLEALAMISASADGGINYQGISSRGARLSSPEIFRSSFRNTGRKKHFELNAKISRYVYNFKVHTNQNNFSYFSETFKEKTRKLAGRSGAGARIFDKSIPKLANNKSILSVLQTYERDYNEVINKLTKFAIYAPSTPILRGVASDNSFHEPLGLYGGNLAKALTEVIRSNKQSKELQRFFKLLDWFQTIGTTSQINPEVAPEASIVGNTVVRYIDKFMKTNFNQLYAYDVSEGALYILFVLILLFHEESPDIFALDNIDSTLNPGLVRELMTHIVEILNVHPEKQVFLTTHNPTTLDAIDLFNESHRLFVVARSKTGQTELKRIEPPKGITKEEWITKYAGMKLSEIWLSGAIGGMPQGF